MKFVWEHNKFGLKDDLLFWTGTLLDDNNNAVGKITIKDNTKRYLLENDATVKARANTYEVHWCNSTIGTKFLPGSEFTLEEAKKYSEYLFADMFLALYRQTLANLERDGKVAKWCEQYLSEKYR